MAEQKRVLAGTHCDEIRECEIFRGLGTAAVDGLLRHACLQHFTKGECVLLAGRRGNAVYIIRDGKVKICLENSNGHIFTIGVMGRAAVLGEINWLDGNGHSATVQALSPMSAWRLCHDQLQPALESMPGLALNLSCMLARRLRHTTLTIEHLSTENLRQRIAHLLLAMVDQLPAKPAGKRIVLRLTQAELAESTGATRGHVNRVLAHFKQCGCLSVHATTGLVIHDEEALRQFCR